MTFSIAAATIRGTTANAVKRSVPRNVRPATLQLNKAFSTARLARAEEDIFSPGPLLKLTEEEEMMKESGRTWQLHF